MKKEDLKQYIPIAVIIGLIIISAFIIKDFILAIISAFILAYLIKPVYARLERKMPKQLAAGLCVAIIILIMIIPVALIVGGIINQAYGSISSTTLKQYSQRISEAPLIENLNIDLEPLIQQSLQYLISLLKGVSAQIPSIAVAIFIAIFGIYYILIDWNKITSKSLKYVPSKDKKEFSKEISTITNNLVYGTLLVALIEVGVAIIGFWISGVNSFLLLSALIGIFAFIPGLGPLIVWVPLAIYYFIEGNYFSLIGVIITGLILSIYVDTVVRTQLSGKKANIHPFIVLIGIIGGVAVFGIFGFIVGPLLLSYTIKIIEEIAES